MITQTILKNIKTAVVLSLFFFVLCGLAYPLSMTGLAQILFPFQANGSIITVDNKEIGSQLIGQDFNDPRFMKSRPSAVNYNTYTQEDLAEGNYGGVSSGSNNYAPSNPLLAERVLADKEEFLANNPTVNQELIPADMLTASGSGLDPHISPASAAIQIPALAQNTGISEEELALIVKRNTEHKWLNVFGADKVNVLGVNVDIAKKLELLGK